MTYVRFLKITTLAAALTLTAADIGYLVSGSGLTVSGGLWTDALLTVGQPDAAASADLAAVLDALLGYAQLKAAYSPGTQAPAAGRLLSVLQQMAAATPDPAPALLALTGWDQVSLGALLRHFYGSASLGGIAAATPLAILRRLSDAFTAVTSSGVTADTLIAATTNDPDSAPGVTTVEDFQAAARSRYAEPDWLAAVTPVNNTLRTLQRDALVAYILVQAGPAILAALGVQATATRPCTADDLFSYFLFDTQMQPCMETSRIRHALSSVQLFIERSLRNLEPLVNPQDIDGQPVDLAQAVSGLAGQPRGLPVAGELARRGAARRPVPHLPDHHEAAAAKRHHRRHRGRGLPRLPQQPRAGRQARAVRHLLRRRRRRDDQLHRARGGLHVGRSPQVLLPLVSRTAPGGRGRRSRSRSRASR